LVLTFALLLAGAAPVAAQDGTPTDQVGTPSAAPLPVSPVGEQLAWVLDVLDEGATSLTAADLTARFAPAFLTAVPAEFVVAYLQQSAALGPFSFEGVTRPPTETQVNALLIGAGGVPFVVPISVETASPHRITGINLAPVPPPLGVQLTPVADDGEIPVAGAERLDGLFDVGGGRRLYLSCVGTGSPTVVLEAGLNDPAAPWFAVERAVAPATRVCTYDRANTVAGASDPAPTPRTGADVVADLHALLDVAGVPGPYVLVGHSIGGLFVRLYASTYPDEVVGLVLVDASHEEQDARLEALVGPDRFAVIQQMALDVEGIDVGASFAEVREARAADPLRPIPLVVVSAGQSIDPAGLPPDWPVEEHQQLRRELSEDLAELVPNARHVVAERSGHYVHQTEPEVVVEAIREVVEAARDPGTWATPVAATPAA
jgi:pimeloyl-ACP methyl ester carboxylesterase